MTINNLVWYYNSINHH